MAPDIKDSMGLAKKTQKSLDSVSQFPSYFSNEHHAYAARKAERLASAIHVVTGFIPREEPIRTRLRELSLGVIKLATDTSLLAEVGPEAFSARSAEIGALLETAESAGLVSAMNSKLILEEYGSLAQFVRDRYSLIRSRPQPISDTIPPPVSFIDQKDKESYRTLYRPQKQTDMNGTTTDRRSKILALLSVKDRISIKDAQQSLPDVSEKTIQRELLSMVSDGTLIKEGERRWSTYKKATTAQGTSL